MKIAVSETAGLASKAEPVRLGLPFARGELSPGGDVLLKDEDGKICASQHFPTAYWPDGSIKWALLDAQVTRRARARQLLIAEAVNAASSSKEQLCGIILDESADSIGIDTGAAKFEISRSSGHPLGSAIVEGESLLAPSGVRLRLSDASGRDLDPHLTALNVVTCGPLRVEVEGRGFWALQKARRRLEFRWTVAFHVGLRRVDLEVLVRNPHAARHKGGLWDLGDPGSVLFSDLSVLVGLDHGSRRLEVALDEGEHSSSELGWTLFQASSGGENWEAPTHVNARGKQALRHRGYSIDGVPSGLRATPVVKCATARAWVGLACEAFWQNFPKAIRWTKKGLDVALFPAEADEIFELQGGEQKRHVTFLEFGTDESVCSLRNCLAPLDLALDPAEVKCTGAVHGFDPLDRADWSEYVHYVQNAIEGPHSMFQKREAIDEYGWRNFGELFADHEAVREEPGKVFPSHYNNQYDAVQGFALQYLRTGEPRWHVLMRELARHVTDIDIYHTTEDRAAFNGGLFWHTDHHKPAGTATHRSYSKQNAGGGKYGGGPSSEHNYTSGLLLYYFLTGDRDAREAVCSLANWVARMDDGRGSVYALIDEGPTGLASRTVSDDYHGPGRGAGNSINALLDGYELTAVRSCLALAEALLARCANPADDIRSIALDDPERRWSYLVFLQSAAKYLRVKEDLGERDYWFCYVRETLVHYARWMRENEVPYKDVLHKVELPTETWCAQDVRKAIVLRAAARYASSVEAETLMRRAEFFKKRCLQDLLEFPSACCTRPMVLLLSYGLGCVTDQAPGKPFEQSSAVQHVFPPPSKFVPQRHRLLKTLREKLAVLSKEVVLLISAKWPTLR